MKTAKLFFSLIIALCFLLLSCDDPSPQIDDFQQLQAEEDDLTFRSTVYFYDQQNVINTERIDAIRTKLKSVGVSGIRMLNSFHIELSHVAYQTGIREMIRLEDGEMMMRGPNGDMLFGKYHGYGSHNSNPGDLKLIISIIDGTGSFAGMQGYLSAYCQNYGWDHRIGEVKFSGYFLHKDLPI